MEYSKDCYSKLNNYDVLFSLYKAMIPIVQKETETQIEQEICTGSHGMQVTTQNSNQVSLMYKTSSMKKPTIELYHIPHLWTKIQYLWGGYKFGEMPCNLVTCISQEKIFIRQFHFPITTLSLIFN